MFDKDGGIPSSSRGRTATFSGNPDATPRYDYNQVLYKLDLSDPRLAVPTPVYDVSAGASPEMFAAAAPAGGKEGRVAFFAPDRPFHGGVAVLAGKDGLSVGGAEEKGVLLTPCPRTPRTRPPGAAAVRVPAQGRRPSRSPSIRRWRGRGMSGRNGRCAGCGGGRGDVVHDRAGGSGRSVRWPSSGKHCATGTASSACC